MFSIILLFIWLALSNIAANINVQTLVVCIGINDNKITEIRKGVNGSVQQTESTPRHLQFQ